MTAWKRRAIKTVRVVLRMILTLVGLYAAAIVIGLFPTNLRFQPSKGDGVVIYVVSSSVHSDLILPMDSDGVNWRDEFRQIKVGTNTEFASHLAIGWGDRGFYLETPAWQDLKISTAANALFLPSQSCMHIEFTKPEFYPDAKAINLSREQYLLLVDYVRGSIRRDSQGLPVQIKGYSYGSSDAFIEALGSYHLFNTCNSWIGRALSHAGVTCPWFSPLPHTPTLYL